MSPLIQDNRCHECKKLFCCSDCRDLHEENKHPKPPVKKDCLLCNFQRLPLKRFADDDYICHLVIRHLPLQCVLCGQLYRTSSDLKKFQTCTLKKRSRKSSSFSVRKDQVGRIPAQATPSPITKTVSCPSNSDNDSPNEQNFHNLHSLTSPPELLIRHTSTPMQIGFSGDRTGATFKTPKVPLAFSLKTPTASFSGNKLSSILTPVNDDGTDVGDGSSQNLFYSATSQLTTSRDSIGKSDVKRGLQTNFDSKSNMNGTDTPSRSSVSYAPANGSGSGYSREFFRTNSGRSLEVMEEQEEQGSVDMELTTPLGGLEKFPETPDPGTSSGTIAECPKEQPKKVRFSDEHRIVADCTTDPTVSDSEEFYEAPEIPGEKSSHSESRLMMKENEENSDKENLENRENSEDFVSPPPSNPSPSSSRVVMMLVVENGYKVSSSDLMPIINSSLKKLESVTTSEKLTTSITSVSGQSENGTGGIVRSVSSVDSYTTSSTLDYYSSPAADVALSVPRARVDPPALFGRNAGGIFSAVAQAMRYALGGLNGAGSPKGIPPAREILRQQRSLDPNGLDPRGPSPGMSAIATSLLRRPGKRSRDSIYDGVQPSHRPAGLRGPRSPSSPVAKRPRSWHRIRGRDPIARMRRDESSESRITGVSSETQQFRQGSLSAGDKILPLPSRAHQSTQTE
ncbi:uncharacterized protein LOC105691674 [Athalia rosae]|uniref:uncharacterized protein LOC105691674 n=1 Tax=Athalia rosae TaxID=37344 RepID=UPI0020337C4F|nr:uncharacterized protein LOC105691674 [Athalia rosae]